MKRRIVIPLICFAIFATSFLGWWSILKKPMASLSAPRIDERDIGIIKEFLRFVENLTIPRIKSHKLIKQLQLENDNYYYGLEPLELLPFQLKKDWSSLLKDKSSSPRILCVTFLSWRENSIDILTRNVYKTPQCQWAVVVYESFGQSQKMLNDQLSSRLQSFNLTDQPFEIIQVPPRNSSTLALYFQKKCEEYLITISGPISSKHLLCSFIRLLPASSELHFHQKDYHTFSNPTIYPKVLLLIAVLQKLPSVDLVWLLDSDIGLDSFSLQRYLVWYQQADWPLVSQPLFSERKAHYPYLNPFSWSDHQKTVPVITATGFVEIQAPFLRSDFLQWFILSFVLPVFQPMLLLGADWGIDDLFCRSGQFFSSSGEKDLDRFFESYQKEKKTFSLFKTRWMKSISSVLFAPGYSFPEKRKISDCALIVGGRLTSEVTLLHQDSQEIQKAMGGRVRKELWNGQLRAMIQQLYPHFYLPGSTESLNVFKHPEQFEMIFER